MATIEDRLAAVEERLAAVEDRLAIAALIAAYGPAADAGDGAALAALFTADAVYEGPDFRFAGRAALAALVAFPTHREWMAKGVAHVLGPHRIEVAGDGATARGHSLALVRGQEGWAAARVSANLWTFRRTEAGWRIATRTNRPLDGRTEARALLALPEGAGAGPAAAP
ncbi:MAG: nuclear transport factor 2 family protein [Rhodobacteraceae bacterium]|nr:nuclear transport factor 2 family protein [Paracoccaceae bacterium]